MAASTGPVLLAGTLEAANQLLQNPAHFAAAFPWRLVPVTAGLALGLALLERAAPQFAVGMAWLLVAGVFIFPPAGGQPLLATVNKTLHL